MTTDRPLLVLTVGLPRSGKSTWARTKPYPIVNPDAIRLAIHGRNFRREAETLVWAHTEIMLRALFLAGHSTVILDSTSTTISRRDRWRNYGMWTVSCKQFTASESTCVQRALDSHRPDLIDVIRNMAATFEPLSSDERRFEEDQS